MFCDTFQEVIFDSLAMSQGGNLHRRLVFPKQSQPTDTYPIFLQTTDLRETIELIRKGFESEDGSGRSQICNCSHDWTTNPEKIRSCTETLEGIFRRGLQFLSQPFTFTAKTVYKPFGSLSHVPDPPSTPVNSCSIEAKLIPDSFVLSKFLILTKLRKCRELRSSLLEELSNTLVKFHRDHIQLVKVRKQLHQEKYATRGERKEVMQVAIDIEKKMIEMDKRLQEINFLICENGRKEVKYFTKLVPVRSDQYFFHLMDARRDPLQVPSEIDQELLINWEKEDDVYHDESAIESLSRGHEIDPGIHIPSWPRHYIDSLILSGFLPAIEVIKVVEPAVVSKKKHYAKFAPMSGQYQYSKKKEKKSSPSAPSPSAQIERPPEINKPRTYRDIPGLARYNVMHMSEIPIYQHSLETKRWSDELSKWFHRVEKIWKKLKFQLCLSFLQKARHLLNSGMRYCVVKATDIRLSYILHHAEVLDLYHLLLCRGGVALKVGLLELSCI